MTIIEKIKAEIERLKDENNKIKCEANEQYCSGYDDAFYDLIPFLDTLESEKPMNQRGLEREIERCLWQLSDGPSNEELRMFARYFAQWQKDQMMKEAVDTVVSLDAGGFPFIEFGVGKFGLKVGDKVRIIVCKKED